MIKKPRLLLLSFLFILTTVFVLAPTDGLCASKRAKINVKKLTLTKNSSYTLRVYNMKKNYTAVFSTSDANIVSVQKTSKPKNALITAVNIGTATIQTGIYNRKGKLVRTLKTTVKVTPYAISIKFTHKKVKLNVSDTQKLSMIIKPNTSQEIPLFESSDSDVVTVNSKGVVTAVAPGEAWITATLLSNGQKAVCKITVEDEVPEPSPTAYYSPAT